MPFLTFYDPKLDEGASEEFLKGVFLVVDQFAIVWTLVLAAEDTLLGESACLFGFGLALRQPSRGSYLDYSGSTEN